MVKRSFLEHSCGTTIRFEGGSGWKPRVLLDDFPTLQTDPNRGLGTALAHYDHCKMLGLTAKCSGAGQLFLHGLPLQVHALQQITASMKFAPHVH